MQPVYLVNGVGVYEWCISVSEWIIYRWMDERPAGTWRNPLASSGASQLTARLFTTLTIMACMASCTALHCSTALRYNSALRIEKSPLLGEILLEEAAEGRYRRIARLSSLRKFYLKTLMVPVGR